MIKKKFIFFTYPIQKSSQKYQNEAEDSFQCFLLPFCMIPCKIYPRPSKILKTLTRFAGIESLDSKNETISSRSGNVHTKNMNSRNPDRNNSTNRNRNRREMQRKLAYELPEDEISNRNTSWERRSEKQRRMSRRSKINGLDETLRGPTIRFQLQRAPKILPFLLSLSIYIDIKRSWEVSMA